MFFKEKGEEASLIPQGFNLKPQLMDGDEDFLSAVGYKFTSPLGTCCALKPTCAHLEKIQSQKYFFGPLALAFALEQNWKNSRASQSFGLENKVA